MCRSCVLYCCLNTGCAADHGFCLWHPLLALLLLLAGQETTGLAARWDCIDALQARSFDDGNAMPDYPENLAFVIPDKQQHKMLVRLLRGLLHPDAACRYTVDPALNEPFYIPSDSTHAFTRTQLTSLGLYNNNRCCMSVTLETGPQDPVW